MVFAKELRERVRRGAITCSVRIWTRPHVKVGGRYRMDDGAIEVDSIEPITLADITPALARRSGFKDVAELLKTAKHGIGSNVYLIRFHYSPSFLPRVGRWVIAVALLGLMGCSGPDPVSTSIGSVATQGPGTRLLLAEQAPFEWDRVCVFGPYTSDDHVKEVTGVDDSAAAAYDIRSNDRIDVLMFIAGDRIARSVAHSRARGDFGPELVGKCYSRAQAVFLVRTPPPDGWGDIGPS